MKNTRVVEHGEGGDWRVENAEIVEHGEREENKRDDLFGSIVENIVGQRCVKNKLKPPVRPLGTPVKRAKLSGKRTSEQDVCRNVKISLLFRLFCL